VVAQPQLDEQKTMYFRRIWQSFTQDWLQGHQTLLKRECFSPMLGSAAQQMQ
jgi:hypothetical protein